MQEKYLFIPRTDSLMSKRSTPQDYSEFKELVRLENKYNIGQILRTDSTVAQSDGTMMRWLSTVMLHAKDKKDAIGKWRSIAQRDGRNIDTDFSEVQKRILRIPDKSIESLFGQTQEYLIYTAPYVKEKMTNQINEYHRWNDKYEIRQKPKRSLEILRENGIRISVKPEDVELIRQEYTEAECPILDKVKNKKIVSINGFTESKASLTVHDIFDHFWIYNQLSQLGILERYRDFLQSVGNPQDTDMFNREGELIASVSFEWRSSHTPERQFKPLFNFDTIKRIFEKAAAKGLSNNQRYAVNILSSLDPQSEEPIRLGSIYSGILVELMEQRRKHGFIRQLDQDYKATGILPLLNPEYLALIVDINHMLCDPQTKAREQVFKTEGIVENYLIALAKRDTIEDFSIKIQDIQNFDPTNSRLSPQRQRWLRDNPFHTATRISSV